MGSATRTGRASTGVLDSVVWGGAVDRDEETELQLGLSWLLRLRWGAVCGQLLTVLAARFAVAPDFSYPTLLTLIAFTAASNTCLMLWSPAAPHTWRLPVVLVVDVLVLMLMLAASGGASNPFTVFFLMHVALAALLLDAALAWAVVALTIHAFAALFFVPSPHIGHADHAPWSTHLVGMWVAYALAAGFIAHSVGRVSRAIRARDRRLADVASLAAQNERLATLSSFSANAAHELGSPLATIGLAAKELALAARRAAPGHELAADAELICREVARCRQILGDLSARAGESVGEMPVRTTPVRIVDELLRSMSPALLPHLHVVYDHATAKTSPIVAPVRALAQVLHNLVRNAFDAQDEAGVEAPITLRIRARARLCFHVLDRGAGFSAGVHARLGEPFVTTKAERGGLGLGIYLARAYAERTGGALRFHARPGGGADVELCLARDALRGDA